MNLSYDVFIGAFLSKITEYDFLNMVRDDGIDTIIGYMKMAISKFKKIVGMT